MILYSSFPFEKGRLVPNFILYFKLTCVSKTGASVGARLGEPKSIKIFKYLEIHINLFRYIIYFFPSRVSALRCSMVGLVSD